MFFYTASHTGKNLIPRMGLLGKEEHTSKMSNEYYPFGLQTANSWTRDNSSNNFLYNAGSELNNTTGMYDLPYRNYDAALGRFFQVDPLAQNTHNFTPYHYAANNPTNANDPTGLDVDYRTYWYNPEYQEQLAEEARQREISRANSELFAATFAMLEGMPHGGSNSPPPPKPGERTVIRDEDGNFVGYRYTGQSARQLFGAIKEMLLSDNPMEIDFNMYGYTLRDVDPTPGVNEDGTVRLASNKMMIPDNQKKGTPWMDFAKAYLAAKLTECQSQVGKTPEQIAKMESDNQVILTMLNAVGAGGNGENSGSNKNAWCAAFVNWCLAQAKVDGTGTAWGPDFKGYGQKLDAPVYGAIGITADGHVAFYDGETGIPGYEYRMLGGNQAGGTKVSYSNYSSSAIVYWCMPIMNSSVDMTGFCD